MIIDAHAHIFERVGGLTGTGNTRSLSFGKVQWGNGKVIRFMPPLAKDTSFPPEVLLEYMDWVGVDKAVLLQGPFYGEANDYIHQAARHWPDRFIGAGYIDPWLKDAEDVFHHVVDELGFNIIKIELREDTGLAGLYQAVRLDDIRIEWLWEEIGKRGLVVTFDLGPIGGKGYQTEAIKRILDKHPGLKMVMTHLCYPPIKARNNEQPNRVWQDQILLAKHPGVWIDLASLPAHVENEDYPYPSACEFIRKAVELVGSEKLLWGSDIPSLLTHATYPQLFRFVAEHCDFLSDTDCARIMGENAIQVYGGRMR